MALTIEQQRALALARARKKRARINEVGNRLQAIPGERIEGAFEDAAPVAQVERPQTGRVQAALEGAGQGLTFGFGDEIGAALDLGISDIGNVGGAYSENLARRRGALEQAREDRPGYTTAGEIGGALATAPVLPMARVAQGAGIGARIAAGAKAGAGYGALYGAGTGDGVEDRAVGALVGAGTGLAAGAAAPVVVKGVQVAGRGLADNRVTAAIRGTIDRTKEAARRIGMASEADAAIPQPRLSLADEAAALRAGQPVLNIDRGGETTRALARSAANLSPQGRAAMETAISDRFAGQGDRIVDTTRRIVGNVRAIDNRVSLQNQARRLNRTAYRAAYEAPSAQRLWDEGLEQLATAPVVQDAMRQAAVTGRNAQALDGFAPIKNPFIVEKETGRLKLRTENGETVFPTLQFWDHVKRNLDGIGTREAKQAAKVLREHLDDLVPEYQRARAGAASFFGAQDALEAGEQFVMSRMENDVARAGFQKLNAAEKKLFAEGFADALARRVAEVGDRRSVINSVFLRSAASRERIEIALGRQKANELEAFLRVEDLLDKARTAVMGNSTTTRQLVELGIAGTAGGYGVTTGDWQSAGTVLGALLARRGLARIERGVAQRVGEMLASPDSAIVQRGLALVARNPRYMDALRAADLPAATGASQQATEALTQAAPR